MESKRQAKIGRLIQKDISNILQRIIKEHFPGSLVTVTKVKVTPDLGMARVNLSIFGKGDKKEIIDYISALNKEIRYELGQLVRNQLRSIPTLSFHIDDSLDYIDNIDRLLKM